MATGGSVDVTGGAGFVGSHVLVELLDAGYNNVIVIDRLDNAIRGVAMLRMTEAGCKEDIESSAEYPQCLSGYQQYMANLASGSAGGSTDGGQMVTALCSPEGQAARECLKEVENCEELKTSNPMFSFFDTLKMMGGCQNAPNLGGGGPGGVCATAMQTCSSMGNTFEADESAMEGATSEFNKFQEQIKTICGQVKSQFECVKQNEKQCPDLENEFKKMMEIGRKQSMPGQPFPDYDTQKNFVMNECQKLPKDFTSNKCVKDNLKTSEYKGCYKNATQEFATEDDSETMSCDGYNAAFPCVTSAIQTCGEKYQNGFRAITNFFLAATEEDCQLTADDTTGSANIQKMSFATILTLLVLGFKVSFM